MNIVYNNLNNQISPTLTLYVFPEFSETKQLVDNVQTNSFEFEDVTSYALMMDAIENGGVDLEFYQTANIDLANLTDTSYHNAAGIYTGNFDGQGYTISNNKSSSGDYLLILKMQQLITFICKIVT